MPWIEAIELSGKHVILAPLTFQHSDDLVTAASDGQLWQLWYTFVPEPSKMQDMLTLRLKWQEEGKMLSFAVIDPLTHQAIGLTSYLNIDGDNKRLEIGGTWYRKSSQRTAVNTECKLMMLTHAFENLNCIAVEFRTHAFNHQSRKAIERLGAKLDGILRNHMILPNKTLRDTCIYSIIQSEWPAVKALLNGYLQRYTPSNFL